MSKTETAWVKPTGRGQMPSGRWADEGGAPFEVTEAAFSKRWMQPLTPKEVKSLLRAAKDGAASNVDLSADLEEANEAIVALKAELSAMTDQRDKMSAAGQELTAQLAAKVDVEIKALNADKAKAKAPPTNSIAGDAKK
jgi:hypothetical protein